MSSIWRLYIGALTKFKGIYCVQFFLCCLFFCGQLLVHSEEITFPEGLDELGTQKGLTISNGKFDRSKDFIVFHPVDFQVFYSKKPVSFEPLANREEDTQGTKNVPILLNDEGFIQGEKRICQCLNKAEYKEKKAIQQRATLLDCENEKAELSCDEGFPVSTFKSGAYKIYVLSLESVEDKKVRIKYNNQIFQADLSLFQINSFRHSTIRYVNEQKQRIGVFVKRGDFETFQKEMKKCLENSETDCLEKYIENSGFIIEKGFKECPHSVMGPGRIFIECIKHDNPNLKQALLGCLKHNEFPGLTLSEINENLIEATVVPGSDGPYCVFKKIGPDWRLVSVGESS